MIRLQSGQYLSPVGARRQTAAARVIETRYTRGMRLPRHSHEFTYMVLMIDGTLTERTGGRSHDLSAGSVVFNQAGQEHEDEVPSPRARCLNVELDPRFMARLEAEGARARESVLYTRVGPAIAAIGRLYAAVIEPGPDIEVEEALVEILTAAWRLPADPRRAAWLNRVVDVLHDRFLDPPALAELADEAGVNHAHLCRAFRAAQGCTIGEYLRALRAGFALGTVTGGRDPLSTVAFRAGFADQSHMTRAFARFYGRSPRRLRNAALRKDCSRTRGAN